jgi:thiamine pyrophosphate-dependent acetolactate synthase large subunit-like protein
VRIEDPADIEAAITDALDCDRPVVLDVVTDPDARAPAPWSPPGFTQDLRQTSETTAWRTRK